ncbi:MAG: RNA methyltransferase [Planctomycetota bacterium]
MTPPAQEAPPRIVLARPRTGENVGLIARLCANFGIDELVLVDPAPGWRDGARRTASMCPEVVARVRILSALEEAVADCLHVHGFTARCGRDRPVRDLLSLGPGDRPRERPWALVFGNEESGLSAAETRCCTALHTIRTFGLPSLNLSHAVAITLSHWSLAESQARNRPGSPRALVDRQGSLLLADHLRRSLSAWGFQIDDPHLEGCLDRLLGTRLIETRDARVLHRILTHLEWVRDRVQLPEVGLHARPIASEDEQGAAGQGPA